MAKLPILLLAAGEASRMGRPKQLLLWDNKYLINNRIETIQATGQPIIVVLGANDQLILPFLSHLSVRVIVNTQWIEGMGTSIEAGTKYIQDEYPESEGILIALVDQPLITTNHFCQLIHHFQPGGKQIILSVSATGWEGSPVIFDRYYFEDLQQLASGEGAKSVIHRYPDKVVRVIADDCLEDIDTPERYLELQKLFNND